MTAQMMLLTVLPLTVIIGIISFGSIYLHHHAMRELVAERDMRVVVATARMLGSEIELRRRALQQIADGQVGAVTTLADREFPDGVALISAEGRRMTSTGVAAWPDDPEWANRAMVDARAGREPAVVDGTLLLSAVGKTSGNVAIGRVRPESLGIDTLLTDTLAFSGESSIVLFDTDGRVLFSAGEQREVGSRLNHAGIQEVIDGKQGVTYRSDTPGALEHVVAFAPVRTSNGPTGLGLFIEEPWEVVVDPLMRYSLAVPLITLPVLLLAALAVTFGVRRIVQPLQELDAQAGKVGAGDFDALQQKVNGIDEIEQLQATLVTMADRIQADQERLRGYANAVTQAQELERARLARELHDDTIQNLIVLSQRAQALRITAARDGSPMAGKFEELRVMALKLVEDVRRLTRALRPIYLDEVGLTGSLERLAREVNASERGQSAGLRVSFAAQGDIPRLNPEVELGLFRIAQEALNNVVQHSGATSASVTLGAEPDGAITLEIQDDGRGFSPEGAAVRDRRHKDPRTGGYGLTGIRERSAAMGARVVISSAQGRGTQIRVTLPAGI